MLNFPLIYKAVGTLLYLEALLLALCLGMGVWAGGGRPHRLRAALGGPPR